MIHVLHSGVAAVSIDAAFAYIDNYETVPDWMFGVSEFTPTGEFTQGLGATFDTCMHVGPTRLRSRVEITEWIENEKITVASLDGVSNSSTWMFRAIDDDHTELSVDFAYKLPGGIAGKALERIVEPFAESAVKNTENTLRRHLEQL